MQYGVADREEQLLSANCLIDWKEDQRVEVSHVAWDGKVKNVESYFLHIFKILVVTIICQNRRTF